MANRSENRGTANASWTGKLYDSDVITIKTELARGTRNAELARRFDVSPQLISKIAHGQKWAWLEVNHD